MTASLGNLLVVDDNEMNRDMLSRRLERAGYQVVVASSGKEALALIEAQTFDLALFDIMMPEVSGLEALAVVRQKYSLADLPVIMVTAKSASEDVVEALRLGANDYVTKPIDFPVLMARVQTHMQLRRLSQLKDEFMRIASHDIKNPLTEVLGIASLVELTTKPNEPIPERVFALLKNLKKSAKKIQYLIEDFLDFQALEAGELKLSIAPVDLNGIARDAFESNQAYATEKAISLDAQLAEGELYVMADERRLSQVVQNLVNNGLKYTPKGGCVTIATRHDGDQAYFAVTDTGPGLSPEDQAKLFMRYAKLSNKPTGGEKSSGLGLAISKDLVTAHQGQIGAENLEGAGACFWITLPLGAS